jgi:hypothetical protein
MRAMRGVSPTLNYEFRSAEGSLSVSSLAAASLYRSLEPDPHADASYGGCDEVVDESRQQIQASADYGQDRSQQPSCLGHDRRTQRH